MQCWMRWSSTYPSAARSRASSWKTSGATAWPSIAKRSASRSDSSTVLERMLGGFSGENFDLFARLLDTGADLIIEGKSKRGIRYFEKAFVLDPSNSVLAFFIGEYFFRINKPELARAYLERAVERRGETIISAMLMLGVICGDDGDLGIG